MEGPDNSPSICIHVQRLDRQAVRQNIAFRTARRKLETSEYNLETTSTDACPCRRRLRTVFGFGYKGKYTAIRTVAETGQTPCGGFSEQKEGTIQPIFCMPHPSNPENKTHNRILGETSISSTHINLLDRLPTEQRSKYSSEVPGPSREFQRGADVCDCCFCRRRHG